MQHGYEARYTLNKTRSNLEQGKEIVLRVQRGSSSD